MHQKYAIFFWIIFHKDAALTSDTLTLIDRLCAQREGAAQFW